MRDVGSPASRLTPSQLNTLRGLAELITPASGEFPSAADADPDDAVLELALAEFDRFLPRLRAFLDEVAAGSSTSDLSALEATDREGYALACDLLVGRYLTCRPVWRLLGYPGRVPAVPTAAEAEPYLREDLLGPVAARGPIYTAVSATEQRARP